MEICICDICHYKIKDLGTDVICQFHFPCIEKQIALKDSDYTQICEYFKSRTPNSMCKSH